MPIKLDGVFYTYAPETPFAYEALRGVSLEIPDHVFLALIGQTGSGKSTLVQHLNGLLTPSQGSVQVGDYLIKKEGKKRLLIDLSRQGEKRLARKKKQFELKDLRKYAGLVFQFPEYQLFEETVIKDVSFGPRNFGVSQEKAEEMAKSALTMVGLDASYYERSPFELSGGEKRRAAIAGIIALDPKVLVLDEPTAGLDPQGEKEMMALFNRIYEAGKSVILVTHNMDLVLKYVGLAAVMSEGKIVKLGTPLEIFQDKDFLQTSSIEPPQVFSVAKALIARGLQLEISRIKDIDSLAAEIRRAVQDGR
jgi:energy-coupling factor transport system ATP-binding protein